MNFPKSTFVEHDKFVSILLILLVSLLSFSINFINPGIFSDDYALVPINNSSIDVLNNWKEGGYFLYWAAYFHDITFKLFSFPQQAILFERFVTFSSYFGASVFFYLTLLRIKLLNRWDCCVIGLFFTVFPVNLVRYQMNLQMYAMSYFAFYSALYCYIRYSETKSYKQFVVSISLFMLSFSTGGIIPLYFLAVGCIVFSTLNLSDLSVRSIIVNIKKHVALFFLPVLYFCIKLTFFEQYGKYTYNYRLMVDNINPTNLYSAFENSILYPVSFSFGFTSWQSFWFIVFIIFNAGIICYWFKNNGTAIVVNINSKILLLIQSMLITFLFSVVAYLAVGKMPSLGFDGLNSSRHQLLIPLSASIFCYLTIVTLSNLFNATQIIRNLMVIVCLLAFTSAHIVNGVWMLIDWYKQEAIVIQLRNNELVKKSTNIIFADKTLSFNHLNRYLNFFEYSGMLKAAYGDESRIGSNCPYPNWLPSEVELNKYIQSKNYNISGYIAVGPEVLVSIELGVKNLSLEDAIKLIYLQNYDNQKFMNEIATIWKINSWPYSGSCEGS